MAYSYYFDRVKAWYTAGVYTKAQVGAFVAKGKLTSDEYTEIVGEPYGN